MTALPISSLFIIMLLLIQTPPVTEFVIGAVYEVFRTHTIDAAGVATELNPHVSLGQFTASKMALRTVSKPVLKVSTKLCLHPCSWFLLPTESFTVEFPRMKDGVVDPNQTLEVYPKVWDYLAKPNFMDQCWSRRNSTAWGSFQIMAGYWVANRFNKNISSWHGNFTTGADGKITVENLPKALIASVKSRHRLVMSHPCNTKWLCQFCHYCNKHCNRQSWPNPV